MGFGFSAERRQPATGIWTQSGTCGRPHHSPQDDLEGQRKFALDEVTGCETPTDITIDDLYAGFPCQDTSSLNMHRSANRNVIRDCGGRVGPVFRSIVDFCKAQMSPSPSRALMVVLENALGLAAKAKGESRSNLDDCLSSLQAAGFEAITWRLDPRDFGQPVSRPRLFMLAFPSSSLELAGIGVDEFRTTAKRLMDAMTCNECHDLDYFLLSENHVLVRQYLRECEARAFGHGSLQRSVALGGSSSPTRCSRPLWRAATI